MVWKRNIFNKRQTQGEGHSLVLARIAEVSYFKKLNMPKYELLQKCFKDYRLKLTSEITSKNLRHEICQVIYSPDWAKKLTNDPHRLLQNLIDKINIKRSDKYVALSNFNIYSMWKNVKRHTKTINFKYWHQSGAKTLDYLMNHIAY